MFIFPKNYNFKNKILGVIDYPTAIFDALVLFVLYKFVFMFKISLTGKLIFLITFYTPVLLMTIINHSEDTVLYLLYYVFKFLMRPKIYLYK